VGALFHDQDLNGHSDSRVRRRAHASEMRKRFIHPALRWNGTVPMVVSVSRGIKTLAVRMLQHNANASRWRAISTPMQKSKRSSIRASVSSEHEVARASRRARERCSLLCRFAGCRAAIPEPRQALRARRKPRWRGNLDFASCDADPRFHAKEIQDRVGIQRGPKCACPSASKI